jgi:hypothetical protein
MEQHRFILDNTRPVRLFKCPSCSRKELKRYVDLESGEYLPEHVGRCNRESKCGYHCTAKQYFQGLGLPSPRVVSTKRPEVTLEPGLIPIEVFKASCEAEMTNHFIDFLSQRYGKSTSLHAKKRFMIGSSKRWPGATCFWQVDENLKVRTGKVILYNKDTCHRVKQPYLSSGNFSDYFTLKH